MRALGVDLGTKRIGIAVSDSAGTVATPLEVLQRKSAHRADHQSLVALADEFEAEALVVGLPLSLDGSVGPAARAVLDEVEELTNEVARGAHRSLPVVTYDERLSTVSADRSLMHQDLSSTERRAVVDQVAAAVILQAWLDAGCPLAAARPEADGG